MRRCGKCCQPWCFRSHQLRCRDLMVSSCQQCCSVALYDACVSHNRRKHEQHRVVSAYSCRCCFEIHLPQNSTYCSRRHDTEQCRYRIWSLRLKHWNLAESCRVCICTHCIEHSKTLCPMPLQLVHQLTERRFTSIPVSALLSSLSNARSFRSSTATVPAPPIDRSVNRGGCTG